MSKKSKRCIVGLLGSLVVLAGVIVGVNMAKTDPVLPGVTITAPEGALCGLYAGTPGTIVYSGGIRPYKALAATSVTTENGITTYYYEPAMLKEGVYHGAASLEGYSSVCQMINYTAEKAADGYLLDIKLDKLAGNGYEAGYVMLNTQEFIDAQFASEKDTWGEEYVHLFNTPQFLREEGRPGKHQQTTNEEMMDFIAKLDQDNDDMYVFSLGKSPKYGYDMPLVLFTRENVAGKTLEEAAELIRNNSKPTVQYTAQVHSNEPVSTEGALAMMLDLDGAYGEKVLDAVDVYIIPRINLDGAFEVIRESPTTGEDMNRDYLYMNNQEVRMVTSAYNLFLPEVCIDGHEKTHNALTKGESLCTDMEVQVGAGSLNHSAAMTEMAMEMALAALGKGRELGLRTHFYDKLASAAGGSAGSSYFGTRNSLSFLVETPGKTHLGMSFMERRVMSQYTLASTVINYTVENAQKVKDTVHASREQMVKTGATYEEDDVIVLQHGSGETGRWASPVVHAVTGEVTEPDYTAAYKEHVKALRFRTRPTAYIIPKGLANEDEILRVASNHAVDYYELPANSVVKVQQYIQKENEATLSDERAISFEQGAYVFPNTVPSTVLGVIMEPDFDSASGRKMTLFSMGLVKGDADGYLPIYRYCHDLVDGKIAP